MTRTIEFHGERGNFDCDLCGKVSDEEDQFATGLVTIDGKDFWACNNCFEPLLEEHNMEENRRLFKEAHG